LGWSYLVIWECELTNTNRIRSRISKFLGPRRKRTNQ
jgi:G:T-mismatch repair DNA endonuclease (very short patch repair protein)